MAKSKPAQADILAELDELPTKPGWHNWMNAHSPEVQELLAEVQRRWKAGHYLKKGTQKGQLFDVLNERYQLGITVASFRNWLGCAKKTND